MVIFSFPAIQVSTAGLASEAEQQLQTTELQGINTELNSQTALLTTVDADTGNISTSVASVDSKTPALGQALAAASVPVVLTAAQISTLTPQTNALTDTQLRASAVPVSAASLPLPTGAATEATLSTLSGKVPANLTVTSTRLLVDGSGVTQPVSGPLTDTQLRATPVPVSGTVAATQSGTWTVQPGNTANTTAWLTQKEKSSTATLANIPGATSSTTLQASNSARKGWSVHNDSSAILYVKFGSTASSTSYTVKLIADAYYELPTTSVYTGIITGIWASATGSARVTELT